IFGPNEDHKGGMRSVVYKGFHQILQTGRMQLFKSHHPEYRDGEQKRDFLYVKDAVEMTLHLAELPLAGGLFNIGSGQAATWVELAQAIFAAMGRPSQIDIIDMPEQLRGNYQYFTEADMTHFKETNYPEPLTSLQDAVRDYVQTYLIPGKHLGDEPWEDEEEDV
ncbi:MAG: NAD-dependent epimerase/dehydratase family protein, partial [Verrucomicrobiales bacterium]